MIRRNSGARRPVGGGPSNSVVDRRPAAAAAAPQAPVVPPLPPRRRRSSGASSRSSSSRGLHSSRSQHASLRPSGRRVAFKNETRVRIAHSWREMSEREWCSTWVMDEDVATTKQNSRKTVKAMRKATLLGASLAPKCCPRGLEHLASPQELARRCRMREDLTKAVLEEQTLQRREGISRPHALARVSSVLSKWTRDDSHQAAMNDAAVAVSIYSEHAENDRRPAPAPPALLTHVDDAARSTTDDASPASSSATATSQEQCSPGSRRRSSSSSGRSSSSSSSSSSRSNKQKTTNDSPSNAKKGASANASTSLKKEDHRGVQSSEAFSMSKLQRSLDITAPRSSTPELELGLPIQQLKETQRRR